MVQKTWFPEVLTGTKVILRRHVPANLAAFRKWYADPEIARLARYQESPMRPEEIERFFAARVVGTDALAMAVHEATNIAGTILIACQYTTAAIFEMHRAEAKTAARSELRVEVALERAPDTHAHLPAQGRQAGVEAHPRPFASARGLITNPIANFPLNYDPEAVDHLIAETRCHPCLIQLTCSALVDLKNEQKSHHATIEDVEQALDEVLKLSGRYVFEGIWEWIPKDERNLLMFAQTAFTQ